MLSYLCVYLLDSKTAKCKVAFSFAGRFDGVTTHQGTCEAETRNEISTSHQGVFLSVLKSAAYLIDSKTAM